MEDNQNILRDELTEFEERIIHLLRKKNITSMDYSGNITIHYSRTNGNVCLPVSAEKREIHS